MTNSKVDYYIAILVGFLTGVFVLPTLFNLGLRERIIFLALPLAVPVIFVAGIWVGGFVSRWFGFFSQLSKFAAVGFLNTAIDFGVLNVLSILTGVTGGFILGGVNVPGFSLAVINSYFWNKFWVFRDRTEKGVFEDFPKFLAVTLLGLLLNSGIVVFITTYVPPILPVGQDVWLNIAKAAATAVALVWNFVGYKFLVFRTKV
ncbi:MAG: GtrA family protein [Candidatus Sungiibacteriota bacterium]|uniref:GtrA family protein n=1 Tax=Candidatus Sungiibacteriota bacterium TaxID=2750080 RepID=A0A7T5RJB0_9BACT|nr:MAG: GtrA family protein [Candidatus Sungbacteria bacterium]